MLNLCKTNATDEFVIDIDPNAICSSEPVDEDIVVISKSRGLFDNENDVKILNTCKMNNEPRTDVKNSKLKILEREGDEKVRMHLHKEAIKIYSRAIAMNNKHGIFFRNRGFANSLLRKFKEAYLDYYKAISLDPGLISSELILRIGIVCNQIGKFQEAIIFFTCVIDPSLIKEYILNPVTTKIGILFSKEPKFNQLDFVTKARQLKEAHLHRGHSFRNLNNFLEAHKDFNQAKIYDSSNEEIEIIQKDMEKKMKLERKIENLKTERIKFQKKNERIHEDKMKLTTKIENLKKGNKYNSILLKMGKEENFVLQKEHETNLKFKKAISKFLNDRFNPNQLTKQYQRNRFLDFHQKFSTNTIFHNSKRNIGLYSSNLDFDENFKTEILCVDLEKDERLNEYVNKTLRKLRNYKEEQNKNELFIIKTLIEDVAKFFEPKEEKMSFKNKKDVILLGEAHGGGCSHRSILFKLICDLFGIECRLIKGYYTKDGHEWNIVKIANKMMMVDLMNSLGLLEINFRNYMYILGKNDESKKINHSPNQSNEMKTPYSEIPTEKWKRIAKNSAQGQVFMASMKNNLTEKIDRVAIKRVEIQPFAKGNQYLKKEIDLMTFLKHRNIMSLKYDFLKTIDDGFVTTHYHCVVMELMDDDGKGFFEKLINSGINELKKAKICLFLFFELLKGIDCLHNDLNIIHRDLKPENVLVKYNRTSFELEDIKIADFGLIKQSETSETYSIVGTQGFVAPEIIEGKKYNKSVDIYSLGKMLERASVLYSQYCPKLQSLQKKCLLKNPKNRPSLEAVMFTVIGELNSLLNK